VEIWSVRDVGKNIMSQVNVMMDLTGKSWYKSQQILSKR